VIARSNHGLPRPPSQHPGPRARGPTGRATLPPLARSSRTSASAEVGAAGIPGPQRASRLCQPTTRRPP
jgi:hypothetical protein